MIFQFQNKKVLYFRITKTASSSILISLRKYDNIEKITYESDKYENYFKFTFVRNPFDRLASCYRHIIQRVGVGSVFLKDNQLSNNMSFEDFVGIISNQKIEDMNIHWRPQYTFLPILDDSEGNMEELGLFVGRYENLQEDYDKVCKMIDLPKNTLLWENSTGKTNYKNYYNNPNIIKKVIEIYKRDFKLFNYSEKYK